MPEFQQVHVIVNPSSGSDAPPIEAIRSHFEAAGVAWHLHKTTEEQGARHRAEQAVAMGADCVVACGGDGTVIGVAQALMHTGVPLAILARGTANVTSTELGIPKALDPALALITGEHEVRRVDVGQVGRGSFFLRLGIGLEAAMTVFASTELKEKWGRWAYIFTALDLRRRLRPVRYRITIDGKTLRERGITCIVCNSGNLGLPGIQILPEIDVSDGTLHVVVIRHATMRAVLKIGWYILMNRLTHDRQFARPYETVRCWAGKEIVVDAEPRQIAALDGEVIDDPFPLTAKVNPGALLVVTPKSEEGAG